MVQLYTRTPQAQPLERQTPRRDYVPPYRGVSVRRRWMSCEPEYRQAAGPEEEEEAIYHGG